MAKYCITAANDTSPDNHCASQFQTWRYSASRQKWVARGSKSLNEVSDLLAAGHTVLSAEHSEDGIRIGAKIEVELRICKNETDYKLSDMPTF